MEPKPVKPTSVSSYAVQFAKQKEKRAKELHSKKDTLGQSNELPSTGPDNSLGHPTFDHAASHVANANMQFQSHYWGLSDNLPSYLSQGYESRYWGHANDPTGYYTQGGQQYQLPVNTRTYPGAGTRADYRQPNYFYSSQHNPANGKII